MTTAEPGVTMRQMNSAQIADDLAERIRTGEYEPHQRLVHRELAEMYGCPPSRIARAMLLLRDRGLVYYVAGVGSYVAEDEPNG